jgi:hypothetical protein
MEELSVQSVHETWAVTTAPPSHTEVCQAIQHLCRNKASGPDEISPALFKDGCETLLTSVTDLLTLVWTTGCVPESWGESTVIPIFKKGVRSVFENHRGISLTPVISKILASIILNRLTPFRERQIREQQAGFRPGRGCIDQIFKLRQLLGHRHAYRQPTIVVFLDFSWLFIQ